MAATSNTTVISNDADQFENVVANNNQITKITAAKLPQTGNNPSISATALGVVLAMFGLGLARDKKRKY
ncbi:LPXTG cell wall anchor domain-containing protein [Limosilactobacillus reuteri]|uniref:LPXTG cell wall anchor domain-containing protein n=1 Tax=Limosilactobacillus reuteri TaxID=1598 RepID=UPI001E345D8A|nr:LPXTG cell wall anchor domain-containing protein [Limosilactobacillus reuteri]MCC4326808.1 LPXTG cell wall anchor domain-containing protein [Limosilactobacillus reuteri]MCC4335063.1 LPXTG cell wall anchor domain-containing protein [Limosilactobacillus reuteri]